MTAKEKLKKLLEWITKEEDMKIMARNKYSGYCYCCGKYIKPGYGHFERHNDG